MSKINIIKSNNKNIMGTEIKNKTFPMHTFKEISKNKYSYPHIELVIYV